MTLTPPDQRLLREILEQGHALEKLWSDTQQTTDSLNCLVTLKSLISKTTLANSEELRRLAFHERNLTIDMSAKHLSTILVPFERLSGKALRDDEILVSANDRIGEVRTTSPLIAIADNIRSSFNVGAILRTAEAFGAEAVWLTGYTPTPLEEKTARTSMGAQDFLPWESIATCGEAISRARAQGYSVIALETADDAEEIGAFEWPEKCALVLGNERFGVDQSILSSVDRIVRIPLHGRKNSLNVGIAFGIAAADWRRSQTSAPIIKPDSTIKPIGYFNSRARHPYEARRQGSVNESKDTGVIELEKGQQFEQALEDLDGFSKIWLLYQFHQNKNWKPKTLPPRGPRTKRGVFATRSPYRPSRLGLSCVDLIKIDGLSIHVQGFDLLDGTPIYDIKPYLPYADAFPEARAGWTESLDRDAYKIELSSNATKQLAWLKDHGVDQLHDFLLSQLEFDPLDDDRKRVVTLSDDRHCLSYRTWRADFKIDYRLVEVQRIYSGYSSSEMQEQADPYSDKFIHREFTAIDWT
jgi:tRNA-Thr(GGU) m(6)t(6)A37 methyltransferase TsaA